MNNYYVYLLESLSQQFFGPEGAQRARDAGAMVAKNLKAHKVYRANVDPTHKAGEIQRDVGTNVNPKTGAGFKATKPHLMGLKQKIQRHAFGTQFIKGLPQRPDVQK